MLKEDSESHGTADGAGGRTRAAQAAARSAASAVGSKVEAVKDEVTDAVAKAGARAKDVVERVKSSAKDSVQKSGRKAQDAAGAVAQTMRGATATVVSPAMGKAQSAIVETKDRLDSAAESATQRAQQARDDIGESWASVREALWRRIETDVAGPARAFTEMATRSRKLLGPSRERIAQAAVAIGAATASAYGMVASAAPQFVELSPLLKAKIAIAGSRG